jgi:uncharacterized membrane protein (DUF2068 family)
VNQNPIGLRIIGGFKLATGVLLVGLGVGLFHWLGDDPGREASRIVSALKFDPENRYIHGAIEWISGVSPRQLEAIRVGTFLYALLYLVEGVGLLMRKHWAEYFTVIATGSAIPIEVYEVWKRLTALRLSVLAINLAIVAYLVYRLIEGRKERAGALNAPARSVT